MKHLIPVVAACALFATGALAQDPAQVGPKIYKQLLDNPRVRVLEATFARPARRSRCTHIPTTPPTCSPAAPCTSPAPPAKTDVYALKKGQTAWLPAQTHAAVNPGSSTVRVLVIELK